MGELANGMERWAGKVAVVTGASAGIGASIVRELVQNGLVVAGLARRVNKIEELAESLDGSSGKVYAVECDVSQENSVLAAFAWIRENLGSVDILINNAGITKDSSLTDGTLEDWRSVFDVNVLGLCLCTREAVRMMKEAEREAIVIHISSLAGEKIPAVPGFNVYPASKRAVTGLAQTLRHELMGTQIRVTSISPGLVETELMATNSMFSKEILTSLPILQPEDIAAAVVYTLSTPAHVQVQDIILRPVGENW
ncbi:farnesol dehydrogenase [Venturia canescens]|uniref:farnesol dehydrogenase n=1 Tax=Venturia canescens TaxID=32260 RepID=UPI001C9D30D5|nr:farnesol dehydrogenase [Venturia canescens]